MWTLTRKLPYLALGITVALVIAFGVLSTPMAGTAHAMMKVGGGSATCYWGGKAYSEGAEIVVNGYKYQCRSDGRWYNVGSVGNAV